MKASTTEGRGPLPATRIPPSPFVQLWRLGAVWIIAGFILGVAAVEVSGWFLVPVVILAVLVKKKSMEIRCPHCGGMAYGWLWGIGSFTKCFRCGKDVV